MDVAYKRFMTVVGCGFIGVFVAALLQVMHGNSMIVDSLIGTAITLPELMGIVVVIFLLLGVVLAALE